jgi:LemA protein
MKKVLIGIIVLALFGAIYLFTTYNSLVSSNEFVDGQWAQVETQYQRRFDLIPNIVQTVKGFAKQEQSVFADIAEARTRYSGATSVADRVRTANQVESALSRLMVVVENYPDLKSSQLFTQLNVELEGTENRISVERKRFNDAIKEYNLQIKRVPSSWVASYFGFEEREYFESAEGSEVVPPVQF